jgi:DNA-binding phage protein
MYGYTVALVNSNKRADRNKIGVKLGIACIKADIPVSQVAKDFGVSRTSIYAWFTGHSIPHLSVHETIEKYIKELA